MRPAVLLFSASALLLISVAAEASPLSWVYLDTQTTIPITDFTGSTISGSSGFVCNANGDCITTSGSADLATGELKMFAFSTGSSAGSAGQVGFGDRIFINEPFSGTLSVTLLATLSGSYLGGEGTWFIIIMNTSTQSTVPQQNRVDVFDGAAVPLTISNTFLVDSAFPYFDFSTFVAAFANTGTADFSHTAAYSVLLPAGFTFSSDSGVFLTQQTTSAPEPSMLLLLLCGGAAMGLRSKFRNREGAAPWSGPVSCSKSA